MSQGPARKLYNFPDKNIDRQIVELVQSLKSLVVPDLSTGKWYLLTVEVSGGVPQLVLTEQ